MVPLTRSSFGGGSTDRVIDRIRPRGDDSLMEILVNVLIGAGFVIYCIYAYVDRRS